jgi:hypothetical protein
MKSTPARWHETLFKAEPGTLIWSEPLAGGDHACVKLYRMRGHLESARRWLVPYRVEREFDLLKYLHGLHVPCAEPLSWTRGHSRRHGCYEILKTLAVPDSESLKKWLGRGTARQPDLGAVFVAARRMHECGVTHGAFYATNILVKSTANDAPDVTIIDFAHGCRFPASVVGTAPAEYDLLDMLRSIERVSSLDGCERWLAGYGLGFRYALKLIWKLRRHRLERPWRHMRRIETDAREFLAAIHHGLVA